MSPLLIFSLVDLRVTNEKKEDSITVCFLAKEDVYLVEVWAPSESFFFSFTVTLELVSSFFPSSLEKTRRRAL